MNGFEDNVYIDESKINVSMTMKDYKSLERQNDIIRDLKHQLEKEIENKTITVHHSKIEDSYETHIYDKSYGELLKEILGYNYDLARLVKRLMGSGIKEFKAWQQDPDKTLIPGALSISLISGGELSS
jgi:hypothetical protein